MMLCYNARLVLADRYSISDAWYAKSKKRIIFCLSSWKADYDSAFCARKKLHQRMVHALHIRENEFNHAILITLLAS